MMNAYRFFGCMLVAGCLLISACSGAAGTGQQAQAPAHSDQPAEAASSGWPLPDSNIALAHYPTQIEFLPNTQAYAWIVSLNPDIPQTFEVKAQAGQRLFINKTGNLRIKVYAPDLHAITTPISTLGVWGVDLPQDGYYRLAVAGDGAGVISIYLPVSANSFSPLNTAVPLPSSPARLAVEAASQPLTASARLNQGQEAGFTLHARAGQRLGIKVQGVSTLTLLSPTQQHIQPASMAMDKSQQITCEWSFQLPASGDYTIVLLGTGLTKLVISEN